MHMTVTAQQQTVMIVTEFDATLDFYSNIYFSVVPPNLQIRYLKL